MFPSGHHSLVFLLLLILTLVRPGAQRSSPVASSALQSKISGVEELLEEFRKQLQQDESGSREQEDAEEDGDQCVRGFVAAEARIIRAGASIAQGAAFLSAPPRVFSWRDCVHACCSRERCSAAIVQEEPEQPGGGLRCYLFNCAYKGLNVCSFSYQPGFSAFTRGNGSTGAWESDQAHTGSRDEAFGVGDDEEAAMHGLDEPPRSDAGQDLVVQLPTDWAVLDGRDSTDDHGISHYHWSQVGGDASIKMKVTHPGLLKLSGLREGVYTFQITVTDTVGQKSSDNVSVSVLPPATNAEGHCSRYQFMCDDGCCIDIGYACDGKQHCPDRSDEDFCQNFDSVHKAIPSKHGPELQTEAAPQAPKENQLADIYKPAQQYDTGKQDMCASPPMAGPCKGLFPRWYYDHESGECRHFQYSGCKGNHNNFLQKSDCENECIHKPRLVAMDQSQKEKLLNSLMQSQNSMPASKIQHILEGHPPPESGAILPLALGLLFSALLLLMAGCRLSLARRRMKKALPLTTEESDYLINGMYL
ncbi:hypothetical protein DNTS_032421 [Danionella cerebrum]|uniref:Low-density lipoprotein receptor-related protein 11 n=1 Tax=Danionella cerebrum TaxID=2873325 RepID=A0A553N182_9TELE|nr:hypothetical protein DNTS_032421 [Danionella translucida]